MKKIVLFGSSGCFGTAFSKICKDINNVNLVELSHSDIDVLDEKKVYDCINTLQPDVVINAVSIVGINPCEEKPDLSFSIHATAVRSMAIASEKANAIFVQTSSHAIFDGTSDVPYVESDIPNAGSIYAVSKYSGELIASMWCKKHYIVRFPTMYGPRRNKSFGFVDKVISWLHEGSELNIASDKIDSPTYSLDAALAVYDIIDNDMPYGIWHISNYFFFFKQKTAYEF